MSEWGKSQTYFWNESSEIGRGSTSFVYRGTHNSTGEEVAIKVFNDGGRHWEILEQYVLKEMETMRKLSHVNVVKLLALENDENGKLIIAMELCTGGSVHHSLETQHPFGLPEEEFILLLEHLSAAIKHLRDNKIVHRDLKPFNIMRFIAEDGQTIYKLVDFGAARELEDTQRFASLCGTKEYLHPDIYEHCAFSEPTNVRSFSSIVDLWSIGATLYHVATGRVPFHCYGKRGTREHDKRMYEMLTMKPVGVISGNQMTEIDPIEWFTDLPDRCQLSEGFKMLLTPLIAGLLETNKEKTWSFDRFFEEIALILRKIIVHVFYINRSSSLSVFLDPDEQIDKLHEVIAHQTKVSKEQQILLFNNELLEKKVTSSSTAKTFPTTTTLNPVYLYNAEEVDVQLPQHEQCKFHFNETIQVPFEFAKNAFYFSHDYKNSIYAFTMRDILIKYCQNQFQEMLITDIKLLWKKCNRLQTNLEHTRGDLIMRTLNGGTRAQPNNDAVTLLLKKFSELKDNFAGIHEAVQQIYKQFVVDDTLNSNWHTKTHAIQCPCRTRACQKANYRVEKLGISLKYIETQLVNSQGVFGEQLRKLEVIKIKSHFERIRALLEEDVIPAVTQLSQCLSDWYKLAQTVYIKTKILTKQLQDCKHNLYETHKKLMNNLTMIMQDSDAILRESYELIKESSLLTLE